MWRSGGVIVKAKKDRRLAGLVGWGFGQLAGVAANV